MKHWRFVVSFVMALSVCAGVLAQEMEPPAELKKFEWMVGSWEGSTKYNMEGMDMESKDTMDIRWDGQFLRITNVGDMGPMKMTETMFISWDAASKKYKSWSFTNFAPTPRIETAEAMGDKFVSISEPWSVPGMAEATVSRFTMTKKSDTEVSFLLEFKEGDKWTKVGEGSAKKKSG